MARTRGKSPQPPVKAATPVTEKQQPIAAAPPHQTPTAVTVKSKNKSKNKITSYQSEGVEDHDVFLLPVSDYWVPSTALAGSLRKDAGISPETRALYLQHAGLFFAGLLSREAWSGL